MSWGSENRSNLNHEDAEERKRYIKMSNDLLNALRQYETPPSSLQLREGVMLGFIPYREGMFGSPAAMCSELIKVEEQKKETALEMARHRNRKYWANLSEERKEAHRIRMRANQRGTQPRGEFCVE